MKRIVMSILLAFVVVGSICLLPEIAAAEVADYDFKTFHWGDSREKVIAVEGVPDGTGTLSGTASEYIAYETTAVGMDVLLAIIGLAPLQPSKRSVKRLIPKLQ